MKNLNPRCSTNWCYLPTWQCPSLYLNKFLSQASCISWWGYQLPKKYLDGVVIYPINISIVSTKECSGQDTLNVAVHNLKHKFTWTSVIADTWNPLLDYDFLNHFNLTVDCRNNRLIDTKTNRQSKAKATLDIMDIVVDQDNATDTMVWKIMGKYPDIISPHRNPNTVNRIFSIGSKLIATLPHFVNHDM